GEIIKWIGAYTDIHDQKTISDKLEKLVVERTKELRRSNDDLQQFAHVASHDLKEPVRKIKTFTGRVKEELSGQLNPKTELYLAKIEKAANRMYTMIDGVLLYSSVNAFQLAEEQVDLNAIIDDIKSDLELIIGSKNATIDASNLPTLTGSPVLIYQLLYNLINNSLKFSKSAVPPIITVSSFEVDPNLKLKHSLPEDIGYYGIRIQDNGIGFEQKLSEVIFDTFSRLNSKDQFEGTGLGLALCKKIVERHGGILYAQAEPEVGATFSVILPVKLNDSQSNAQQRQ
ncbi:MAG: PAS domain-containing sensor histidine kinase, partial [Chitinophagaceae bacterium]|nr:PAS domain-containing sensor histidine kinase [Chitinophagaceae bacterium]